MHHIVIDKYIYVCRNEIAYNVLCYSNMLSIIFVRQVSKSNTKFYMASDSAPTPAVVHIWAVICRVCVMRCGNYSGCKWWSTTQLYCVHIQGSIVRGMLDLDGVSPDRYNVQGLCHVGRP